MKGITLKGSVLIFLLGMVSIFTLFTCKEDEPKINIVLHDKPLDVIQSYIQGKWKLRKVTGGICNGCYPPPKNLSSFFYKYFYGPPIGTSHGGPQRARLWSNRGLRGWHGWEADLGNRIAETGNRIERATLLLIVILSYVEGSLDLPCWDTAERNGKGKRSFDCARLRSG